MQRMWQEITCYIWQEITCYVAGAALEEQGSRKLETKATERKKLYELYGERLGNMFNFGNKREKSSTVGDRTEISPFDIGPRPTKFSFLMRFFF